jgi:3-hydroxybutyryl-CoA dehydrogenase
MHFELIDLGGSRSFPAGDSFRALAGKRAETTVIVGGEAQAVAQACAALDVAEKRLVAVELGTECLGFHSGEAFAAMECNVVGFARFRLGNEAPSSLVELVRQPATAQAALAVARAIFEGAGLEVVICGDFPGRIVDSLIRPYLNSALASLDEGLAGTSQLDEALRLGLGYPKGPLELLEQTGLEAHYEITSQLHAATGSPEFFPARRARVAAMRKKGALS